MTAAKPLALEMPDRERWSSVRGGSVADGASDREVVIFAPPGASIERAFRRAQAIDPGERVRIIGHGASRASHSTRRPLLLTELDAYLPCERAPLVEEAAARLREWLRDTFAGVLPEDLPPERVLWASAMLRAFATSFAAYPLARGLAHHHAKDTVVCLDGKWQGRVALAHMIAAEGGTWIEDADDGLKTPWALAVSAHTALNLGAAVALRAREYMREAPSRARIAKLHGRRERPDVWIGLVGSWPRSCRAVIEGVAGAARDHGATVGVLLQGTLLPGTSQADLAGDGLVLPSLDHPLLEGVVTAVEQCTAAESVSDVARNALATAVGAARVGYRLAKAGPRLSLGPLPVDLRPHVKGLARLATIEVLRAREAALATKKLLAARDFRGARVVWPHASVANVVVPDLMMQGAGATTFDLVHGALAEPMDFVTHARTWSSCVVWWTDAEKRYVSRYIPGQDAVGGYVPRAVVRREANEPVHEGAPLRLLVVSNYATAAFNGPYAQDHYQDALLDAVREATDACRVPLEIRWRPHPYDDKGRVRASLARWAGKHAITLSTTPDGLQGELAWADAVVSSISSSIVETLLHPVALFVHDIPMHERDVLMGLFDPARRFSGAAELRERFAAFVATRSLDAEQDLRVSFFGPSGKPRDLYELVWRRTRDRVLWS